MKATSLDSWPSDYPFCHLPYFLAYCISATLLCLTAEIHQRIFDNSSVHSHPILPKSQIITACIGLYVLTTTLQVRLNIRSSVLCTPYIQCVL